MLPRPLLLFCHGWLSGRSLAKLFEIIVNANLAAVIVRRLVTHVGQSEGLLIFAVVLCQLFEV